MDSLSQLALGAAVGVAVMGRRTATWKAALWGGVGGTLPDLDALVDFGDPVLDMVLHRADTHALLWLTLVAPAFAWGVARLHGEQAIFRRWWLALWLALFTHPLLDAFTIYGTQLLRPFSDEPLGLGSVFIIDPLYTLPLLAGLVLALVSRSAGGPDGRVGPSGLGRQANLAGLALSSAYLLWSLVAQQQAREVAREALATRGLPATAVLVTPAPFTTLLWRIMVVDGEQIHEGFWGLLDGRRELRLHAYPSGHDHLERLQGGPHGNDRLQRIRRFSDGFYRLREADGRLLIADLRMGQYPAFVFEFAVAQRAGERWQAIVPASVGGRLDPAPGLRWLWRRVQGEPLDPPGL